MKAPGICLLVVCLAAAQSKDWAGLTRYGSDNAELRPPKPDEARVVFLGDQVTERWDNFFPGKPYLNRGIAGQTSAQMLVRFHQDVVALKPKVVVIQAGVNDLLVATEGVIADNYMSMMDIAKANGIRVVLASVTPVCDCYTKQTGLRPQGKIISLNGWIRDFAAAHGAVYLNYYSALADGRNFKKELTDDGLLPNAAAYALMAPLAEKAIADALGLKIALAAPSPQSEPRPSGSGGHPRAHRSLTVAARMGRLLPRGVRAVHASVGQAGSLRADCQSAQPSPLGKSLSQIGKDLV